jgi:hypothetical protein
MRCEWGRDDYSLNVKELAPVVAVEQANGRRGGQGKTGAGRGKKGNAQPLPLFDGLDPQEES